MRLAHVVAPLCLVPWTADAAVVLLTRRDASQIVSWDSAAPNMTKLVHTTKCNDVDLNTAEGVELAWIAEHYDDNFGRFIVGSGMGLDAMFHLGDPGLTHYDYPKHIVAYNGEVVIMSRNDATIWRYTPLAVEIGSVKTPASLGQGMATDGTDLYVSLWTASPSVFVRYDAAFTDQQTIPNPTGMGNLDNIFDFVHDPATDHWFGLATTGEFGTPTEATTILEFEMGGAVVKSYPIPVNADGIGRMNATTCGDLVVEGGEACDDGNTADDDACTAACELATCGDGLVWAGMEACDDGNTVDDDACTNACTAPACGDGIVQPGEQCDDPDPRLCDECMLVRPDLTTTTATTEPGDDTTGSAADTTTATTTTGDTTTAPPPDSTSDPDSASGGFSGGATGDAPTTGGSVDPTAPPAGTTTTGGFSGTDGTSSDDGCGCTASAPSLAPLFVLLALRRRRLTAAARRAGPTAP